MCHLVLLMPLVGLVVFWILPISAAIPVYLVILLLSGIVYYAMMKAMKRPVVTGDEGLTGKTAKVIEMSGHEGQVKVEGAIWSAESDDLLRKGDKALVLEVHDLTLKVGKLPLSKER